MNNLEEELLKAIESYPATRTEIENWDLEGFSKAAASVAMKWMEKTFIAGENNGHNRNYLVPADEEGQKADFKKFLKRNGLTPTEPDTKELKQ